MDILLPYYRVTGVHALSSTGPAAQRQGPRYMLRQTINRNVAPTDVKRLFRLSDCAISGRYAETRAHLSAPQSLSHRYRSRAETQKKTSRENSSTGPSIWNQAPSKCCISLP